MKWGKPCEQEDRRTDSRAVMWEGREARNVAGEQSAKVPEAVGAQVQKRVLISP